MKKNTLSDRAPRTVVFPGSFDPFTNGHADIVERALDIFSEVVVAVLDNPAKATLFTPEERVELIQKHFTRKRGRVRVESFRGLLVEFAERIESRVIIRGLRAISDYDYEAQMALVNRKLRPGIETFFLTSREEHAYISSTVVKQVAMLGGDVETMVPPIVVSALERLYRQKKATHGAVRRRG